MLMKEYAFISLLFPNGPGAVDSNSKNNMQTAANSLEWRIVDGLYANLKQPIRLFNILPVSSFPKHYSKAIVKSYYFNTPYSETNENIGYVNLPLIRRFFISLGILRRIRKWMKDNDKQYIVFLYTINDFFMFPISRLKKKKNFHACAIVADLPDYTSLGKGSLFQNIVQKLSTSFIKKRISSIDSFVLLTEQMATFLNICVPFVVVEGMVSSKIRVLPSTITNTIAYTGSLHRRFGVLDLVEAFRSLNRYDVKLVICGNGDSYTEIKRISEEDSRIVFLGEVSQKEAVDIQRKAKVLVNPRNSSEEYTKYSFPSKNLEYLVSGRPVICYKLDGIPREYDDYLIYVDGNGVNNLAKTIDAVLGMDDAELRRIGNKGQVFALAEKNEIIQTKRITAMLNRVIKN